MQIRLPGATARPSFAMTLAAGLALQSFGCSSGSEASPPVQRTDSAGIAIVQSDGTDVPLAWRFERRLSIGDESSGEAAFSTLFPDGVAVDDSGRIVVLDSQNSRLIVFDSSGRHLASFGRKGGGPGELQFPSTLRLDPDGHAVVSDFSKRELVRFALDGTVLPGVPRPGEQPVTRFALTEEGLVMSRRDGGRNEPNFEAIVLVRDTVPETVTRVERPRTEMVMYESCRIGMSLGPIFDPQLLWDAAGDRIVVVPEATYTVDVYEGTRRVSSIRRDVPPVPTTPEMATRELGDGLTVRWSTNECTLDPKEVIEKRGMAPVLPAISRVKLAPDGTIWVARGVVKGDTALVDVFSQTGEYRGTLPKGTPFPAAFFPNGEVVAIELDELDVPRLAIYRVHGLDRLGEPARRSGA